VNGHLAFLERAAEQALSIRKGRKRLVLPPICRKISIGGVGRHVRAEVQMPFALQLRELLGRRDSLVPREFAKGEPLESVLRHGAAPNLPREYCDAINGLSIGPVAGSCGTAAYRGRPVYVSDIANDPLWEGYRDLALVHGLRACWSTPIRNSDDKLLGTFAVYHKRPRSPTPEELESIRSITEHVARAIMFYRGSHYEDELEPTGDSPAERPKLRLVHDSDADPGHQDL
jgi:GAF domain-containing protein